MKFSLQKAEQYAVINLHEEKLTSAIAPALKAELVNLHSEQYTNIILNLAEVKYADSSGLSSILVGDRMSRETQGMFVLATCSDHVLKLLKISQLDTILNIIPTLEESIDAVFMNELEKNFRAETNED